LCSWHRGAGPVRFSTLNADDNPDLSLLYGIRSIPTQLYFVGGNLRAQVVGTVSKEAIIAKLQTLCGDQIKASATRTP
jgi:thioredoxin 1